MEGLSRCSTRKFLCHCIIILQLPKEIKVHLPMNSPLHHVIDMGIGVGKRGKTDSRNNLEIGDQPLTTLTMVQFLR